MRLPSERQLIADYGRRMTRDRLVVGTSGNLSIRSGDLLAVTPAGHAYDTLTPELVCVAGLLADSTLRVPIQASYPLAQADQALKALTTQHTQGKVAVTLP